MLLLPPRLGVCPICAVDHRANEPHDAGSLYYQYRFYGIRGRWPTWADAAAHCDAATRAAWRAALEERGRPWTEPPDGAEPIADPPAESVRQPIGDIGSRTFGPEPEAE